MNRGMMMSHLALADRHATRGQVLIAEQRDRVDRLRRDGRDAGALEEFLGRLEDIQRLHIEHRDRLLRELEDDEQARHV